MVVLSTRQEGARHYGGNIERVNVVMLSYLLITDDSDSSNSDCLLNCFVQPAANSSNLTKRKITVCEQHDNINNTYWMLDEAIL